MRDYDLDATLGSGQTFRWKKQQGKWCGIIGGQNIRLELKPDAILAERFGGNPDEAALREYLQTGTDLEAILKTFPDDPFMQKAIASCRGLRLLRQDPWECLASFILSSTKQIVQIEQIIKSLSENFGGKLPSPKGDSAFAFPGPDRLMECTEKELRQCKMGFRAPYLLATAKIIGAHEFDLEGLKSLPLEEARLRLLTLPGIGPKIADCVLLFAFGFSHAFPIDVWVAKALEKIYFRRRPRKLSSLKTFVEKHFGPHAGYAQQYLFHYMRVAGRGEEVKKGL